MAYSLGCGDCVVQHETADRGFLVVRRALGLARALGVETQVAIETSGWGVIKLYVEAGLGISVVPSVCLTGKERVWGIPFGEYLPARSYGIFTRRDRPLSPHARRLVRMIAPDFPDPS